MLVYEFARCPCSPSSAVLTLNVRPATGKLGKRDRLIDLETALKLMEQEEDGSYSLDMVWHTMKRQAPAGLSRYYKAIYAPLIL